MGGWLCTSVHGFGGGYARKHKVPVRVSKVFFVLKHKEKDKICWKKHYCTPKSCVCIIILLYVTQFSCKLSPLSIKHPSFVAVYRTHPRIIPTHRTLHRKTTHTFTHACGCVCMGACVCVCWLGCERMCVCRQHLLQHRRIKNAQRDLRPAFELGEVVVVLTISHHLLHWQFEPGRKSGCG